MIWVLLGLFGCAETQDFEIWSPEDTGLLADEVDQPAVLASGLEGPKGIAWWQNQLFVAEESGGRVVSIEAGDIWAEDLIGPTWLAAEEDWLLIADGAGGSVELLDIDGGRVTLSAGHISIGRIALVDGEAWWLDPDEGELWSALVPGGEARLRADDLANPVGLSVVAGVPWIAEQESGLLTEVNPETGELTTLAVLDDPPHDLIREGDVAFLTTRSTRWPYGGFILAVDSGDVDELAYSPPEPERIGLSEDYVIWSSKQSLTRVSRQGGTYELAAGVTAVEDFITVGEVIRWTDGQTGEVLEW
jgi:hypothetical protein